MSRAYTPPTLQQYLAARAKGPEAVAALWVGADDTVAPPPVAAPAAAPKPRGPRQGSML